MTGPQESAANPQPTIRDRENACIRRYIAARQAEEYAEAERLALAALGPGWKPWMKLLLLDSDYHRSGDRMPVATVYKVYRGDERLSENAVYLRRMPDGQIRQSRDYETLLGDLLHEPHPTRALEVRGRQVSSPRYCLCWSALERYQPRTAEELATLRASRERKKAEREEKVSVHAAGWPHGRIVRRLASAWTRRHRFLTLTWPPRHRRCSRICTGRLRSSPR